VTIRFDDRARAISLSARDLVESETPSGHLVLDIVQTQAARMAAGRRVHVKEQAARSAEEDRYEPEVRLRTQLAVGEWTVTIAGRVDGVVQQPERTLVEEIKSTALDAAQLADADASTWPAWTAQLQVYLWIMVREQWVSPTGRLVVISLSDGSRHLIGVPHDQQRFDTFVIERCQRLVERRTARLAWYSTRRLRGVPWPHSGWRVGQREIIDAASDALHEGHRLLVQAPTGMGKTAALLASALRHALARDRQVFWATSRNTQQANVNATLDRFRAHGLSLRSLTLRSREKACLNEVVSCRPDACRFAHHYHDKVSDHQLIEHLTAVGRVTESQLEKTGQQHEVCPVQLALEVSEHVDVLIGDYNYVFSPGAQLRRHFGARPQGWVVIGDEVHQLVHRARGYYSPTVSAADADEAQTMLRAHPDYSPFLEIAQRVHRAIHEAARDARQEPPLRHGAAEFPVSVTRWKVLAEQIDDVGLDYALLKARTPLDGAVPDDPWLRVARQVLAFANRLDHDDEHTHTIVHTDPDHPSVGVLCVDAAPYLRPLMSKLAGFIGASATVTPSAFYRDLLGLPDEIATIHTPSPFPPENRKILVAPRVSTAWRDRRSHAQATAELTEGCVRATPGNTAIYFPSFAMLRDISARWHLPDHEVLVQRPAMKPSVRARWLTRMSEDGPPVALAAVLGGIFAEGIDLPAGALSAIVVVGPALPPIGLERDLLKEYYERRFSKGFRYASLVPGITRVVQAAGRLIRRDGDRGVIVLVGRRFRWRDIANLLPPDWDPTVTDDPRVQLTEFWGTA